MAFIDDITCDALDLGTKGLNVASGADDASGEWIRDATIPLDMVYQVREKYQNVL